MIEKLRMWSMQRAFTQSALSMTTRHAAVAAPQGALRRRVLRSSGAKKRHVENMTRLPTKRMATACWAFIVAKSTAPETAPLLDFFPLQRANRKNHQQLIHNCLWMVWGQI
jgi:hypothetical protein